MKIRNFELKEVTGTSEKDWKYRATIEVETGIFRKKTERVEIFKKFGGSWFFVSNGAFLHGRMVGRLVRAYVAKKGKELHECPC